MTQMTPHAALKVLMLASSYPTSEGDTASVFLRYLAEELSNQGVGVHVLVPSQGKGETKVEGKIIVHRFQYFFLRLQKLAYGSGIMPNLKREPWLWIQIPFFLLSMTYSFLRLIRKERFSLIHAHWILPQGLIGVLGKYLFNIPLITTAHGADAFALRGGLTARLKRFVVARSDAWTVNTPATGSAISQLAVLPKRHVIPMGVNVRLFANGNPKTLRVKLAESEQLVLFVGRLIEKKGCHYLLEALPLLTPAQRKRTRVWIIGDGDHRSQLERYATALGVSNKVRFWGAISNHLLPDFYAAADLFVAPSIEVASGDTEGQGVVLLEAFSARACVLATRVGGIDDVVTDGVTGFLVEPRDSRLLAAAMEKLLCDASLRTLLQENAFAKVNERYGWGKIASEFTTLYWQISKSRQKPS